MGYLAAICKTLRITTDRLKEEVSMPHLKLFYVYYPSTQGATIKGFFLFLFLGGGADDGDIIKREKKAAIYKWEIHSLKEITNHHFFKQLKGVC